MKIQKQKAFTLIELLVTIAIIGILAAIVLVNLSRSRAKSRDAKRIADLQQLSLGLNLYFDTVGHMPQNYAGSGACEIERNPAEYSQSMQEMVDAGLIATIPTSPGTQSYPYGYCYFDYGQDTAAGALLVTKLETVDPSTSGIPPSCRPWPSGANWCDQSENQFYCICNQY
jgi:prepilin-type N-terminal cleavage/methylation domain-containing protein